MKAEISFSFDLELPVPGSPGYEQQVTYQEVLELIMDQFRLAPVTMIREFEYGNMLFNPGASWVLKSSS
jgi:hypothetical protein